MSNGYFHPLQEDISKLSDEDVSKRIKELSRKVGTARRLGRNPEILNKLQEALDILKRIVRGIQNQSSFFLLSYSLAREGRPSTSVGI